MIYRFGQTKYVFLKFLFFNLFLLPLKHFYLIIQHMLYKLAIGKIFMQLVSKIRKEK